jgi:hypothetical protein
MFLCSSTKARNNHEAKPCDDTFFDRTTDLGLQRSEIVAFINTLNRMSESLNAVEKFRRIWIDRDRLATSPSSSSSSHVGQATSAAMPTTETRLGAGLGGVQRTPSSRRVSNPSSPSPSPNRKGGQGQSQLALFGRQGRHLGEMVSQLVELCRNSVASCLNVLASLGRAAGVKL